MPVEEGVGVRLSLEIEATMKQLITRETNHLPRADHGDQAAAHRKGGMKMQIEMHFSRQVIVQAEDTVVQTTYRSMHGIHVTLHFTCNE